jgi:flagellar motor switch protein FliG
MKEFPIYEADRPTTVIPAEYQQDVLFINCINQRNIREEFERKVRDQFKDKFKEHLKQNQGELNLKEMFTKVDKRAETFLLENIIGEDPNLKDRIPVFDFEL